MNLRDTNKIKRNTKRLNLFILIGFSILILFLNNFVPFPNDISYFISNLDNVKSHYDEDIWILYSFLRTPVYEILGPLINNQALFIILSYFAYFVLVLSLYFLFSSLFIEKRLALLFSLSFMSLALYVKVFDIAFTSNRLFLASFFYPVHFGFMPASFTVRIIVGAIWVLSIFSVLKDKKLLLYFLIALSFLIHPNNSLAIVSQISCCYILLFLRSKKWKDLAPVLIVLLITILCLLPTFYILSSLKSSAYSFIDNKYWYYALLKDEGDDTSPLYYLLKTPLLLGVYSLICLYFTISILLTKKYFRSSIFIYQGKIDNFCGEPVTVRLVNLIIAPAIIFLVVLGIELYSIISNDFRFISLVISTQFGMKIIQMASLPLFCFFAVYIMKRFDRDQINLRILRIGLLILIFFPLIALSIEKFDKFGDKLILHKYFFSTSEKTSYLSTVNTICQKKQIEPMYRPLIKFDRKTEGYINKYKNKLNPFELNQLDNEVKSFAVLDTSYKQIIAGCERLIELTNLINTKIAKGEFIILPPYFSDMRDFLPEYSIFFSDKHDGNLMLGGRFIASVFHERVVSLIGESYGSMGSLESGILEAQTRNLFLKIDEKRLKNLAKKYPKYKFFVTEKKHILSFPVVGKTANFVIYQIH